MKGQLYIKHETETAWSDAFRRFGVIMGDGFVETLDGVPPLKDFVTFTTRVTAGRDIRPVPVIDARDVTLNFVIFGNSDTDYRNKKAEFVRFLTTNPEVALKVPSALGDNFAAHLIYTGKNVAYGEAFNRCRGTISAKFTEPDPTNRGGQTKTQAVLTDEKNAILFGGGAFLIP